MTFPIDFYELMPAVYRREDAGLRPPQALLDIISTEAGHLQRNITGLWDDFFIETANEWVIPYIADLALGHNAATPGGRGLARGRGEDDLVPAAQGTPRMLDDLAGDVTGWGARAILFFYLLMEWTQYPDHLRMAASAHPGRVDPGRDGQHRQH